MVTAAVCKIETSGPVKYFDTNRGEILKFQCFLSG